MPNWLNRDAAAQQIDILLFDAFSNHCLANTLEPLRAANSIAGRPVYRWRVLTVSDRFVTSSSGLRIEADGVLADGQGDLLIVMPSYRVRDYSGGAARRRLRGAASRYRALAGFDTGSWLLADAGLLNGRRATIHWDELERFAETFSQVDATRARYVVDGDRITSSGALAAFDVVLAMIGEAHGQAMRLEVATLFMSADASSSPGLAVPRGRAARRAVEAMQTNLETPLSIGEIARRAGLGQRNLEQRMREELGVSPRAVYRRLRLIQARKLMREHDMPVAEVALRCGYQSASAMTRAFKAEFEVTPTQMRHEGQARG